MKKLFSFALIVAAMAVNSTAFAQQKIVRLGTTSSKLELGRVNESTSNLTIIRYFLAGYNTICLPFDVCAADLRNTVGEDVMLEKMVKVEGNNLYFLDVTENGIEAGVPYLIYCPKTISASFTTNSPNSLLREPQAISINGVTMLATFEKMNPTNYYGIPALQETDLLQSILIRTEGDKCFLPTRCGFTTENANMVPEIKHVTALNECTAIKTLLANDTAVDIYSVNGTLVKRSIRMNTAMKTLPQGIYVVNGQKFMVK